MRWSLRCGIVATERLLLPNHGRDGAVFYTYAAQQYSALPNVGTIFLHGHGETWHIKCHDIFARARLWYAEAERDAGGAFCECEEVCSVTGVARRPAPLLLPC